MQDHRHLIAGLVLASLLTASPSPALAEGFSSGLGGKTVVRLSRTNPPEVILPAAQISVTATGRDASVANRVASLLESQLLEQDKRLSKAPTNPQILVEVKVLRSEGSSVWETRQETERQRSGTNAQGKATYSNVSVTVRYLVLKHTFSATCTVTDQRARTTLDSSSTNHPYQESFREGVGAPDLSAVADRAIGAAVAQMVRRLTFTREIVGVLIPQGSLKDAARFAEAGLWNKYLESLEALPPRPKPKDEAYRQFAIGVAHEALGYAAEDPETTLNYLEKASVLYNKALEMNPGEKFFREPYGGSSVGGFLRPGRPGPNAPPPANADPPLPRVQAALIKYQKVTETKQTLQAAKGMTTSGGTAKSVDVPRRNPNTMDNEAVIDMVQAGLADDVILTAVTSAPETTFDVSSSGLIQLSKGGVKAPLLKQIQAIAIKKNAKK